MSLTEALVDQIQARTESSTAREQAALFTLDAVASAYAGSQTPVGRKLCAWAGQQPLNSRTQAFLMGALTHITETDDLHRASVTHPGCIVVPCVLALAGTRAIQDNRIPEAILCGFEAMCRIGIAVGPAHYRIFHNTATCGPFGSAMAAATLLGFNKKQCVNALGNAGTQASGFWEFLDTGSMSKHLHAGRGAEAGLLAAELAELDFTGPATILEGAKGFFAGMCPDAKPEQVLAGPETDWQLLQTSIKPWPSCRHTHPAIDAALELHAQLGNRQVRQVQINTYQAALNLCDRPQPQNEYQAKFSLQHCVAQALVTGEVTLDSFSDAAIRSVTTLRQQTLVHCDSDLERRYPRSWGARLIIQTDDQTTLCATRTDCKGDPELPLSKEEMLQKAHGLLEYGGLGRLQSRDLSSAILGLSQSMLITPFMQSFLRHVLPAGSCS